VWTLSTNHGAGRTCSPISYSDTPRARSANQLEHCSNAGCFRDPTPSRNQAAAPSYRQAFGKRRCLVPADGFFEWKKVPGGKIPYLIGMKDDFCVCWVVGRMERPGKRRVVAYLHHHHWRTKRICTGNTHPDAGDPIPRSITILGYPAKAEKRSWSLSLRTK
jgi:hypothetical protein